MSDSSWWLQADQCARSDAELRQLGHTLRKDERRAEKASLLNHIRSIDHDARYVQRLLLKFHLEESCVFANLRCGSWCIQPQLHCGFAVCNSVFQVRSAAVRHNLFQKHRWALWQVGFQSAPSQFAPRNRRREGRRRCGC